MSRTGPKSSSKKRKVSFAPSILKASAFGARRGSTPPDSSIQKKKMVELTGKEIAEKLKSSRLTSLAEALESQPRQISKVIEEKATSMLDLYLEIGQRKSTLACFNLKVTTKAGVEETFAPRCCRIKNPVTGSQSVKDSEEFKQIVVEYNEIISSYKEKARNLLLRAPKLAVSTREKLLQSEVFNALKSIAMNLVIEETTRTKIVNPNTNLLLTDKEIAYQAARQYVLSLQTSTANAIFFEETTQMKKAFTDSIITENIDVNDFNQRSNDEDKRILFQVKDKLNHLFPKMTTELWQKVQEDEILRQIKENQAIFNQNKTQNETNELVADAILQEPNISNTQLEAAIKNIVNKEFKSHKNKARKNSLADSKSQESNATKSGRSSSKNGKHRKQEPTNTSSTSPKNKKQEESTSHKKRGMKRKRDGENYGRKHLKEGSREGLASEGKHKRRKPSQN